MSDREMEEIRAGMTSSTKPVSSKTSRYDDYDDDEDEEDYEDDIDDDEDDDDDAVSSKLEKAITIGGFLIGAVIIIILIVVIGNMAGLFNKMCIRDRIFSVRPLLTAGIFLFCGALLFQLITLPVEFNASRRADVYKRQRSDCLSAQEGP